MHPIIETIKLPQDINKPICVGYNNDDGTVTLVWASTIEEAIDIEVNEDTKDLFKKDPYLDDNEELLIGGEFSSEEIFC